MCGIFGIISEKNLSNKQISNLKKPWIKEGQTTKVYFVIFMKIEILHLFFQDSIIDLGKNANQPFKKFNKVIMFNGEIYNYLELRKELEYKYKFFTNSDTEVLITAYQEYGKSIF